ncbi:MAG: carbohydrate kinase family protein [Verrucomicrobia bacterium]|nr:MAG: carbohydrate kinase family protein [Verrucomicrobiota bacterium]
MTAFKDRALAQLRSAAKLAASKRALVGLDGFVDTIVTPVAQRTGRGEAFTAIGTIPEFADRVAGAAGKSTNIEFYPLQDKLGGNGPIMAAALLAGGTRITYVGALGWPALHPVFHPLAAHAEVVSLCNPGTTIAVEFRDGKLMLGQLRSLDCITLPKIDEVMGANKFRAALAAADLVALVNWTMIPAMSGIFAALLEDVLPGLPPRPREAPPRLFFFDLADPEKRTRADLSAVLRLIARFEAFGRVTLGLNLKEAQQVADVLGLESPERDEASLRASAAAIRSELGVATVVVHPRESAACATTEGTFWVPGPYTANPTITTGAGDHFNGGFCQGQLIGFAPEDCLTLGVCTSGFYVRTGQSPSLSEVESFLANWAGVL